MRRSLPALGLYLAATFCLTPAIGQQPSVFQIEFTNPGLLPSHWVLKLNPDGSGYFDSDGGQPPAGEENSIQAGDVHRAIRLSSQFTDRVFGTARRRLFRTSCDSQMKVAFQGTKVLSYSGPEGRGSCSYNYSKDKEIQALGESLLAVENTLLYGARLEKLLQHDRLGLDREMEDLVNSTHDGNAIELGSIRDTLIRIATNDDVIERVRKKARLLLTQIRP